MVGACAPVPASSTSTSCYELTACRSLHHAIAFYPRPQCIIQYKVQHQQRICLHGFCTHRHRIQFELHDNEVPSLSVSALLLPPSIRYKVQDFVTACHCLEGVFLREKKKRKSRAAGQLSRWSCPGTFGELYHQGGSHMVALAQDFTMAFMVYHGLSRAPAITLAHLILRSKARLRSRLSSGVEALLPSSYLLCRCPVQSKHLQLLIYSALPVFFPFFSCVFSIKSPVCAMTACHRHRKCMKM